MFAEEEDRCLRECFEYQCVDHRHDDRCLPRSRGDRLLGCELCNDGAHGGAGRTACAQLSGNDPANGPGQRHFAPLGSIPGALRRRDQFGEKFDLAWKPEQLPTGYIASVMAAILLFELLPYVEEFFRGLRANAGKLVPMKARRAKPGQTTLR